MLEDILKFQMLALQLKVDGFFFLRRKILEFYWIKIRVLHFLLRLTFIIFLIALLESIFISWLIIIRDKGSVFVFTVRTWILIGIVSILVGFMLVKSFRIIGILDQVRFIKLSLRISWLLDLIIVKSKIFWIRLFVEILAIWS